MKIFTTPAVMAMLAGTAFAHSWLDCVDTRVSNLAAAQANPAGVPIKQECLGYPRKKVDDGNWIAESTNYVYDFKEEFACRASQRGPEATPAKPVATATPGSKLLMRFWGNGHSVYGKGFLKDRDPGLVRIFWAGKRDTEIKYARELNEMSWIPGAQGNFSGDAINYINDKGQLVEPANYFEFQVPKDIENGRHMMVWVWAWNKSGIKSGTHGNPNVYDKGWDNAWGTCFDLQIVKSTFTGTNRDILRNKEGFSQTDFEKEGNKERQNEMCTPECYRGGMEKEKCTGEACPPCRYNNGNKVSCYGYVSGDKCPFPTGWDCKKGTSAAYNTPATHARKHRARRF